MQIGILDRLVEQVVAAYKRLEVAATEYFEAEHAAEVDPLCTIRLIEVADSVKHAQDDLAIALQALTAAYEQRED